MSIDNDKFQFIEIFGDPVDRLFGLLGAFCARRGGGGACERAMPERAWVLKIKAKQKPNQIAF